MVWFIWYASRSLVLTHCNFHLCNYHYTCNPGNLNTSLETTQKLSEIRAQYRDVRIQEAELMAVVNAISNLLDEMNQASWDSVQKVSQGLNYTLLEILYWPIFECVNQGIYTRIMFFKKIIFANFFFAFPFVKKSV